MKTICTIGFAAVLLGGCGDKDTSSSTATSSTISDARVTAEIQDYEAKARASTAMTGIDAATGEAATMPADTNSAVPLAQPTANETALDAKKPLPPTDAPTAPKEEIDVLPSVAE